MERKKLSVADRSFQNIREGNFLYADKTEYIYKMLEVNYYNCCFLSRPRRFGKTLLLKTIGDLFQRDRKLFKGLWIDAQSDYSFEKHPVLNFNMAFANMKSADKLIDWIEDDMRQLAVESNVSLPSNSSGSSGKTMHWLLKGLYDKHGVGAVILVDEYDAPITDTISDRELALKNRKVLHDFYRSIKINIDYVHFAFVTGITRLGMTSLDSGPNNFKDISLLPEYAGICGFTPTELDYLFKDRFEDTLRILKDNGGIDSNADEQALKAKILEWYDGYNWLGPERVLNPYSILNFFDENTFDSRWPISGAPSHLRFLARESPQEYILPSHNSYTSKEIRKAELTNLQAIPILFHSGYLTIDNEIAKERHVRGQMVMIKEFTFKPPNLEVELDYGASLFLEAFPSGKEMVRDLSKKFPDALLEKNSLLVSELLHDLLSSIASERHATDRHLASEQYYHAILHGSFLAAGFEVYSQGSGAHGRPDITLFFNGNIRVVIELKYCYPDKLTYDAINNDEDLASKELLTALDKGEKQIIEKDYAGPYRANRCQVIGLAIALRGRDEVAARFIDP
ncbi:MAG: ATP-binding protein [Deltaproteobacteria bacterium]|jgi:hypothetical protein|nr:ATP-binding protein [Deltaproteobacteria bacterium]